VLVALSLVAEWSIDCIVCLGAQPENKPIKSTKNIAEKMGVG